jgi:uncharacterized membrane protein YhaH (DUF805 family)
LLNRVIASSSQRDRLLALGAASDQYLAGFWVAAGGNLILAAGAVMAGVAFRRWTDRNQRLRSAATVFALGFLIVAVGKTQSQIDNPTIEPSGAAGWLDAAQAYVLVIAMVCAAVGFQRARSGPLGFSAPKAESVGAD